MKMKIIETKNIHMIDKENHLAHFLAMKYQICFIKAFNQFKFL